MGLTIKRLHTEEGTNPYNQVKWELRDAMVGPFHQNSVLFPSFWSQNSTNIVADKYFRGKLDTPNREYSAGQIIGRVVHWYSHKGLEQRYFANDNDFQVFRDELTHLLLHQRACFNSPVWFNVGRTEDKPPRVSACFTLSVEDNMESILQWYVDEGMVFKTGSGAGINLSTLREEGALLIDGGYASGPVSFMRGADASAGTIKSGGAARRAAKMVVLNVNHPDIEKFIDCKVIAEKAARALKAAGFKVGLGGEDNWLLHYQNANNSVGCWDPFFKAVQEDTTYDLVSPVGNRVVGKAYARGILRKIAEAIWDCADPGIFFLGNMNKWHTSPETGLLQVANPCGEFVRQDSSCNLASLRLTKYLREDGTFDVNAFVYDVELLITAMDISVSEAEYPNQKIRDNVHRYRELGLGYADLGALIMQLGIPYDSPQGRAWAATITAVMAGAAWRQSAKLAKELGPYPGWENKENREAHLRVMNQHYQAACASPDWEYVPSELRIEARLSWATAFNDGERYGYRNAQCTLLAPTGTISLMMDCDTTGVEPDFSLVKTKKLADGGSMQIINQSVPIALKRLGYNDLEVKELCNNVLKHGNLRGVVDKETEPIFACAVGEDAIHWRGHLDMVAAVQPFLCGSCSKTFNLPSTATVEDIEEAIMEGWQKGLKNMSFYRDGSKADQPLNISKKEEEVKIAKPMTQNDLRGVLGLPPVTEEWGKDPAPPSYSLPKDTTWTPIPTRRKLPRRRPRASGDSFHIGECEGYLHTGSHQDGTLGEIFMTVSKQGSTLRGMLDCFSIVTSLALQHGVPLETLVSKLSGQWFPPQGVTNDPDVPMATSLIDYVFRRLAVDHLTPEQREILHVQTAQERSQALDGGEVTPTPLVASDAPLCPVCGVFMRQAGTCFVCGDCGRTSGCS